LQCSSSISVALNQRQDQLQAFVMIKRETLSFQGPFRRPRRFQFRIIKAKTLAAPFAAKL
jgi:hypothetical protein